MNRHARPTLLLLFLMLLIPSAMAQTPADYSWQDVIGEMMDDTDEDAAQWEEMYDALADAAENPIRLNAATKDDLERLPFLSADEVEAILEYIYRNGELKSVAELAMVSSLAPEHRRLLPYFIAIDSQENPRSPSFKRLLSYGKSQLAATATVPFYDRQGDRNGYLGYKYRHSLRYEFSSGDYLRVGLLGAQDAGEPFFSGGNGWGYDFYSYYLSIRKMGRLKNLTVGRYRMRMGMGLLVNNNLSMGKTIGLSTLTRTGAAISPHSSRSSYNYLQGAAATVGVARHLDLTAFFSYKDFDATLNTDDGTIATILRSGYHRTEAEMRKKNNASQLAAGANISYGSGGLTLGASAFYATLDKPLRPNTSQTYRRYYASGRHFYGMSLDYGYRGGPFLFRGETATGSSHAWATINTLSYRLSSSLSAVCIQRYYSMRYSSLFAQSFSEGGSVQNESGLYAGLSWLPSRRLSVSYYADVAYFPWAKYQAATSSRSFDNMLSASCTLRRLTFSMRYRLKMRQKDNASKTELIWKTDHRMRLSALYAAMSWSLKAQLDATACRYKDFSRGYMASLSASCQSVRRLDIYATAGYFHTDDFNSRIYSYERGMLYDFSFPSYYGEGLRCALMLRCKPVASLSVAAKVSSTSYFDRSSVGTGLQQVGRSSLTDIQMQVRWKF